MSRSRKSEEQKLRRKIQQDLEAAFRAEQRNSAGGAHAPSESAPESINAPGSPAILQIYRSQMEAEVCARYPEFIKCENHLNEVRWLTVQELQAEQEFYPVEEGFLARIRRVFSKPKKLPEPDDEEFRQRLREMKQEIEREVEERRHRYRQFMEQAEKEKQFDREQKIYQQEVDRFYKAKPGYKKYRDHIGNTRWMKPEEFENQEEYIEECLTAGQLTIRYLLWGIPAVLVLTFFVYYTVFNDGREVKPGYVVVDSVTEKTQLYIDQQMAPGFSPGQPYAVQPGRHSVSVIVPGYEVVPALHQAEISEADTVRLTFQLNEHSLADFGTVLIRSPFADARIYIDAEFHGETGANQTIPIPAGQHTVVVKKEGFATFPPQMVINLVKGDSVVLNFRFNELKSSRVNTEAELASQVGLISVHSNIKQARIYLDGQDTGFKTDYVLQKIPYGHHSIRLEKPGFTVYPEEKTLLLDRKNKNVRADFTLSSLSRRIQLETSPVAGAIIVDGKELGSGSVTISLPLGQHSLSFGPVKNYRRPKARTLTLSENGPRVFRFEYKSGFQVVFQPGRIQPAGPGFYIYSGYIDENNIFKRNTAAGPDLRSAKSADGQVWNLGYAFQYRNPPGRDALVMYFNLPENLNLLDPIDVKLWIYRSGNNYPLVLAGKPVYRLELNGSIIRREQRPLYAEDELSQDHFETYRLNEFLRRGQNRLRISVTDNTSQFITLWKVVVE